MLCAIILDLCNLDIVNGVLLKNYCNIIVTAHNYVDYAYCKRTESDGSEKWYNFDDSRITEIDESEVVVRMIFF